MPESEVVGFLRSRKEALLRKEQAQMRALARRWLAVEQKLKAEMEALAAELAKANYVNEALILRHARFQSLMWQARAEVSRFNDFAAELIGKTQTEMSRQGIEDALRALRTIYREAGAAMPGFNVLPVRALEIMFGFAADGSPLKTLLTRAYPEAVNGLTDALVKGLAFGNHPTDVGRKMAEEFGIGLNRALTVARTETLRAYRMGSFEQYRESGVVIGYKRMAAHDERVCAGCLFQDGQLITSLDGEFDEHPNGRCTAVPVVLGLPEPTWVSAADWFETQPEATQRTILGPARFDAWQNGADLAQMSKFVSDPTWGGSYVPTPVAEIGNQ